MGRFHKILEPGVNLLVPILDKIKYVQSLKEIAIEIPQQGAITLDNVQLQLDGVLYLRVVDAYKVWKSILKFLFVIFRLHTVLTTQSLLLLSWHRLRCVQKLGKSVLIPCSKSEKR